MLKINGIETKIKVESHLDCSMEVDNKIVYVTLVSTVDDMINDMLVYKSGLMQEYTKVELDMRVNDYGGLGDEDFSKAIETKVREVLSRS